MFNVSNSKFSSGLFEILKLFCPPKGLCNNCRAPILEKKWFSLLEKPWNFNVIKIKEKIRKNEKRKGFQLKRKEKKVTIKTKKKKKKN